MSETAPSGSRTQGVAPGPDAQVQPVTRHGSARRGGLPITDEIHAFERVYRFLVNARVKRGGWFRKAGTFNHATGWLDAEAAIYEQIAIRRNHREKVGG